MSEIELFYEEKKVALINFDGETYTLEYDPLWILDGFEISPALGFNKKIESLSIKYFLDNLLPEGEALEDLVSHYKISKQNIIRLTELVGEDAAGAIKFTKALKSGSFRPLSEKELAKRLDERSTKSLIIWDNKLRLSAAGVQDKLSVTILDEQMGFGDGDIASTHILKFQKENNKLKHLVLNEFYCLGLAKKIGLGVCDAQFKRVGQHPVLFVKRFDREVISSKKISRKHVLDGCQALDLKKTYKYEKNQGHGGDADNIRDGVSFKKLLDFSYETVVPGITITKVLKWMVFNFAISNFDAHGKNISFFVSKKGIELAPFYDLICISPYDLHDEFAMGIDGEFELSEIGAFEFIEFCKENEINLKLLKKVMKDELKKIITSLDLVELPKVNSDEAIFIEEVKSIIKVNVEILRDIEANLN